jgi:signal transduction histidine kinase
MAYLAAAANLAFGHWEITIAYRPLPRRVRELEQSRAHLVDDSAARLRRIERDLHDGAQAQMVAVTMKLGLAVKKLGGMTGGAGQADVERVLELVVAAHRGAKEAIAELRDLARGIHPPVSTRAWASRSPASPRVMTCPSSWSSTCQSARRPRSRPSPTSAPPSCSPT